MAPTTTSRTGKLRPGFTLLEIILALAVIGLIATVLIGGSARLLAAKPMTPDDVFWSAVHRARKMALTEGKNITMSFDAKAKNFVLSDGTAAPVTINVPNVSLDMGADFLPGGDAPSSAALIGGQLVETQTIPSVMFYADGTCTPFRMQLKNQNGAHQIKIDPWTCAPILTPLNPDGTPVIQTH